ncbi:hypothetical protein EVAR_8570_1 [Eumeta japonica]|uniref:Uncharacterized protein n=1 Tax=Eumeta variegata TaxID=151549 RepID=A0A4C1TXG0_EUMVA|nr:hypothetical protein EVAR_8570_1 [Eumeta japonica]
MQFKIPSTTAAPPVGENIVKAKKTENRKFQQRSAVHPERPRFVALSLSVGGANDCKSKLTINKSVTTQQVLPLMFRTRYLLSIGGREWPRTKRVASPPAGTEFNHDHG